MTVFRSFLTEKLVPLDQVLLYFFCIFKKLGVLLEFIYDSVFATRGKSQEFQTKFCVYVCGGDAFYINAILYKLSVYKH